MTSSSTSSSANDGARSVSGGAAARRVLYAALATAAAYYLGAKIGFALKAPPEPVSALWPPNAILLGILLLTRVRIWPVILLAALPAHLAVELGSGVPLPMVLSWYVSNCTEALIGGAAIRWMIPRPVRFDTFHRVGSFVVLGAGVAPFLSSFLDAGFVHWHAFGADPEFWSVWRARLFSNVLSTLTIVPAIVHLRGARPSKLRAVDPRRLLEAALLVTALFVVSLLAFGRQSPPPLKAFVLLMVPLPVLMWAAVRFGPAGASGCLLVFDLLSVLEAIHGNGPFVGYSARQNVLSLQLFLIATYVPIIALAAVIRERTMAEEEARRKQERLDLAIAAAQMGTWDLDVRTQLLTLSAESRRMYGLSEAESTVPGQVCKSRISAVDRSRVAEAAHRAVAFRAPYEAEFMVERPDGTVRWVLSKGRVTLDVAGHPTRMCGVHVDVTDRHLADTSLRREAELRQRATQLRELADAMPQIVWTARPDGRIDYVNQKWYELVGAPTGEVDEDIWLATLHPDDRVLWRNAWRSNVREGRPHECEVRFWSGRDATYRWQLTRALPVADGEGRVARWYGTATDIDDRQRAEHALRESESNLRALGEELEARVVERTRELERMNRTLVGEISVRARTELALRASEECFSKAFRGSPEPISIIRCAQRDIVEVNEAWERMFGFNHDEAVGRTIEDLGIRVNTTDALIMEGLLVEQGHLREFEVDVRNKNGEVLRAVLSRVTVELNGEPCFITMTRDITERRRAEHEVEAQRRQLAHLGRVALVGELSGALAHELNQPLAAILANARAGQRLLKLDELNRPELRAILDDIASDGLRAGAVIRRVRTMLRKGEAEPQRLIANEVVDEVLDLARNDLLQRAVTVDVRYAAELSPIKVDRVQLQQVILNVVVNACEAMAEKPLSARRLVISTHNDDGRVRLSIADCGTGIRTDPIDSVFEPFYTSKAHGLGLGLAICRSIIEAHGGRMWAMNNEAGGATFHMLLPAADVEPRADARMPWGPTGMYGLQAPVGGHSSPI